MSFSCARALGVGFGMWAAGIWTLAAVAAALPVADFELANGMRFLVVERPGQPMVAAGWVVIAGSGDERPGNGASHLLEHLMFQGTEVIGTRDWNRERALMGERDGLESERRSARPDSRRAAEIARRIAEVEAELGQVRIEGESAKLYAEWGALGADAQTTKDFSMYTVQIPTARIEAWFWMESDRLLHPVFRGLYREPAVVAQERRERLSSSALGPALEEFDHRFWGDGHPYSWSTDGLDFDATVLDRSDLRRHFERFYRPENLVAALVGDLDPAAVRDLAERYFGRLDGAGDRARGQDPPKPGEPPAGPIGQRLPEPIGPGGKGRDLVRVCRCRPQVEVRFRTVAFADRDAPVLDVVAGLLNGRSGRLHRALVTGGRTFSAAARHTAMRRDGSFSLFAFGPTEGSSLEALEEALVGEVAKLGSEEISEAELERVKRRIETDSARETKESPDLLRRLLIYAGLGDWRAIERPKAVWAVTAQDVARVAKRYFVGERRSVLRLVAETTGSGVEEPR